MSINIIAACDLNSAIGFENKLLCSLPSDMSHFKALTEGHYCIMGKRTYESIGKPLSNRINVILTRNKSYKAPLGTFVYHSIEEVIQAYNNQNNNTSDLFFIGGEEVYRQAIPYCDKLYLTIIDHKFEQVDTYFPQFSLDEWKPVSNVKIKRDEHNPYDHYFVEYSRKHNQK